jgi:predicted metalloendopeptidase
VIISDLEYFKSLDRVLQQTNGRVIRDYMAWRMMQRIGYLGSDKFREYELAFRKVQTGVEKSEGMDRRCLDLLSDTVPDLVGRTYVDNFFTKSDKEAANQMVEEVLTRFKAIVKQKEWMDERTRQNSMMKAEKIVVNTGYQEWLMDERQLMQEYDFVSIPPSLFLSSPF